MKTILLAAHLRVMGLLGGTRDVVTGLASNGRPEKEGGDRTLGLFLNTVPLRMQLRPCSWRALLAQVFDEEREIYAHRRYPLAKLQQQNGGPLFETLFNFVNFHVYRRLGETSASVLSASTFEQTNFTLTTNASASPLPS